MHPANRRHRPALRALAATAVTLATLALPTTAATAQPQDVHPAGDALSSLTLTIAPEESTSHNPRTVVLECDPTGGTHPTPEDACATLAAVDGVFEDLNPGQFTCLPYWDPVIVTATGNWGDRTIDFQDWHSNVTCADAATDGIFAF